MALAVKTEFEKLYTEDEAIIMLGLQDRPNPRGALLWLVRTKRLGCVRLARGIIRFRLIDIQRFIEANHRPAA